MIIFLSQGQLGNQLFQYLFLKKIRLSEELIITSGFEELKNIFGISDVVFFEKFLPKRKGLILRQIYFILDFLARFKLISIVEVEREPVLNGYTREGISLYKSIGLFKKIVFVKLGYFQSQNFFNSYDAGLLRIKSSYVGEAVSFMAGKPKNSYNVFVHVRRGDYKKWKVLGESVLLPMEYFKERVNWFVDNKSNCFFVFLTDDPLLIEENFSYLDNKVISSQNSSGVDMAIMTLCHGGILSPSSFGWWGSYLMKERDVVFAPEYWLGFNSGIEYHKSALPDYARIIV